MLLRIDSLMNARPDRRLETWTGRARKWADGPLEEAYYDSDSRRVITCWGWAEVYDYASRVYAGLIRDYYPMRWKVFFAGLQQEKPPSLDVWEETWLSFSLQAISGVPRSKRSGGGASHAGHLQN